MKKNFFFVLATALASLAVVVVTTASWAFIHQEPTPEELK
ncbi:cyclic lactone autoinducer peptide [Paenibacillus sp. R14(2021)]|nr:cyclic lactone autoinducer peptide [Paenibacillus sp. R14(2021)]